MAKKTMTQKEREDWDLLYEYVRSNVMGYDKNQSLSKTMSLRLKGLLTNKFIENNNIKDSANYSFETILNTFKYCSPMIQKALRSNNWENETHKFNYVLKIVEKNINDVYMRMKNAEKAKEKIEEVDTTIATYNGVGYKTKENKKDKFSDLW